jgi:hypothetical protein
MAIRMVLQEEDLVNGRMKGQQSRKPDESWGY